VGPQRGGWCWASDMPKRQTRARLATRWASVCCCCWCGCCSTTPSAERAACVGPAITTSFVAGEGECAWYGCMSEPAGMLAGQYGQAAGTWVVQVRLGGGLGWNVLGSVVVDVRCRCSPAY
jgi:hypothetical protein